MSSMGLPCSLGTAVYGMFSSGLLLGRWDGTPVYVAPRAKSVLVHKDGPLRVLGLTGKSVLVLGGTLHTRLRAP